MNKDTKKILSFIFFLIAAFFVYFGEEETTKNENNNEVQQKQVEQTEPVNSNSNLKVYFLDVGQADSVLIENNQKYTLIDAGNNEDGPKLVTYFKSLGIESFDYLIGTHAHEDHIGGMDDIIENFAVDTFYMPDAITTTKTFEEILDALDVKSIAFETPEIDGTFSMEDCKFNVLHISDDSSDLNDTSIVLKMNYGNNSFLFTGDATDKVEKKILNKNLKSDVFKVSHHGSHYSNSQEFLNKVNPKYSIISVGKNNSYNHPTPSVLNKLNKIGTQIYRTDDSGTIIATSDGTNISFETIKTNTNG